MLKVAEEAIAKKKRIEQLKTTTAEGEWLANMIDVPVVKPVHLNTHKHSFANHVEWEGSWHQGHQGQEVQNHTTNAVGCFYAVKQMNQMKHNFLYMAADLAANPNHLIFFCTF